MRIDVAARRSKAFNLTSLVDVIFLLLLFFMLTSSFLRYSEIQVTAGTATVPSTKPSMVLRVESDGLVVVNGTRTTVDNLEALLRKIDPPFGTMAAVVGGRSGTAQDLVSASEALRRAGLGVLLLHR